MIDESEHIRRNVAGEAAEQESGSLAYRSHLPVLNKEDVRFDLKWDDIQVREPIGFGGFSQVFRVNISEDLDKSYALKCLNPQTRLRTKSFRTGAVDLAIEGEILSRLEHENIIKLHGICGGGPRKAYIESDRGYFLVLDLLNDTLSNKLERYRANCRDVRPNKRGSMGVVSEMPPPSSRPLSSNSKDMTHSAVLERVSSVAMGVAKGMEYLHEKGVALRDLKPDNVGFDETGTPKIFDLGFAREVHTIKSTEVAGSLRYMAPEVASGSGSQLASDVYSFGVLLWEICTLEKPYKHIGSRDDFMTMVIHNEWRHSTSAIPSNSLRRLIKECWQANPLRRPTFSQIVKRLRVEMTLTKVEPTKNKGFGSSVSLKRTATWTAKKLSGGLSSSSFGILRLGFKSGSSLNSKKTEATSSLKSEESQSPTSRKNATFEVTDKNYGEGVKPSLFSRQSNTIMELPEQPSPEPKRIQLPTMPVSCTSVR